MQRKLTGSLNKDSCSTVETKLRVMFPFSPYLVSYFQNNHRQITTELNKEPDFRALCDVPVAESGGNGQEFMVKIIRKHLKLYKLDDCLLSIDRHIEWYVFDVAVLEVQNRFGTRYGVEYADSLIQFIQRFILCAAHQTHHLFEEEEVKAAAQSSLNPQVFFAITDDPESGDEAEDEFVFEEEESDEDIGGMMAADDSGDDDESDDDESDDDEVYFEAFPEHFESGNVCEI